MLRRVAKWVCSQTTALPPKWTKFTKKATFKIDMDHMRAHGGHFEFMFNFFKNKIEETDAVSVYQIMYPIMNQNRFRLLLHEKMPTFQSQLEEMDIPRLLNYKYLIHYGSSDSVYSTNIKIMLSELLANRVHSPYLHELLIQDVLKFLPEQSQNFLNKYEELCKEDYQFDLPHSLFILYSNDFTLGFKILRLRNKIAIMEYRKIPLDKEELTRDYQEIFTMLQENGHARLSSLLNHYNLKIFLLPFRYFDQRIVTRIKGIFQLCFFEGLSMGTICSKQYDTTIILQYLCQNLNETHFSQFKCLIFQAGKFMGNEHFIFTIQLLNRLKIVTPSVSQQLQMNMTSLQPINKLYQIGLALKLTGPQILSLSIFEEGALSTGIQTIKAKSQTYLRYLLDTNSSQYHQFFKLNIREHINEDDSFDLLKIEAFLTVLITIESPLLFLPKLMSLTLSPYCLLAINYLLLFNPQLMKLNPTFKQHHKGNIMPIPQATPLRQKLLQRRKIGVSMNEWENGFVIEFAKDKEGVLLVTKDDEMKGLEYKVPVGVIRLAKAFWKKKGWKVSLVYESDGDEMQLPTNLFN